jgi:hypothetical protein
VEKKKLRHQGTKTPRKKKGIARREAREGRILTLSRRPCGAFLFF